MTTTEQPIVIVGGGAGGAELAVRLAKAGRRDVLLIDQSSTHVWKPRLHELAGGARRASVDEIGYAELAERWGFAFQQGELSDVDPRAQRLRLAPIRGVDGHISVAERAVDYRVLVLAIGGVTPDMGVSGVREHAAVLDRAPDAEALYRRLSYGLLAKTQPGNDTPLRIVIVGSGLTGVELAAHMANDRMCSTFAPRSAMPPIDIAVLEAADTFMPGMDDDVRETVRERLQDSGITIHTGRQVIRVQADAVELDDGESWPSDITVWTAGRIGPPVAARIAGLETNDKQQWTVRDTLQTTVSDRIFALGDCAYIASGPSPATAQAASEQAEHLATQVRAYLDGRTPTAFRFKDKGTLLSFGEAGSVGKIRGLFGLDLTIHGRLSRAAYRGLDRQHQYVLLGAAHAAAEIAGDVFEGAIGPRLKVH